MYGADVYRLTIYTRIYSNGGYYHVKDYIGEPDDKYLWQKETLTLSSDSSFQVAFKNNVIEVLMYCSVVSRIYMLACCVMKPRSCLIT